MAYSFKAFVSVSEIQMGKSLMIGVTNRGSSDLHYFEATFGKYNGTIMDEEYDGIGNPWIVPKWAKYCENSLWGTCKITPYRYRRFSDGSMSIPEEGEPCNIALTVPDPTSLSSMDITIGENNRLPIRRNDNNFTHEFVCNFFGSTYPISDSAKSYCDWTPSYDMAKQIKTMTCANATIVCTTKNGNAVVGKTETVFRLIVPENDNTKPSIISYEIAPITDLTGDLLPLYIRGKTGLRAQISATSKYSDIAEYEVTAGSVGAKGNPGNIEVLANDGDVTVTVKVTDARGFSRTVTQSIYVYPYSRPKIVPYSGYSDIVCERAKATGELHSDGTYLAIMAGKRFTSIVKDGAELNSCRLRYRCKPTTVETFGDWVTLLADGSGDTEIQVLAGNVVSNTNASYDIELSAIDAVGGEHTIRFPIMTSAISFVVYEGVDGAAFGKFPEEPHVVDIASHMTLRVRGRLEVLGASWASLGLADGMDESPYAYGRQDDTGCYYQVSNGNHVQIAFNCSYEYGGSAMVVNRTPIPEDHRPERTVCSLCPTNDRRLALVTVQPDGYIRLEWIQTIASTSNTASATVLWVDGYLDYWT